MDDGFALFLLFVLALWALIYAFVIERRRHRDAAAADEKFKILTRQVDFIEQSLRRGARTALPAEAAHPSPVAATVAAPCPNCGAPLAATAQFCVRCGASVAVAAPIHKPLETPPAVAAHTTAPTHPPLVIPKSAIPATEQPAPPPRPMPIAPVRTTVPAPAAQSAAAASATAGTVPSRPAVPAMAAPQPLPPRTTLPSGGPMFSSVAKPAAKKPARSFEEMLGVKLLPIIGIAIVVLGVGFLVGAAWGGIPHWLRALIIYAGGLGLLVGGIFLEKKRRYQTLGRALIGGGWAVLALVTYAIANVKPLQVPLDKDVDLFLLLAVIGAMVLHTLKYNSQVVTGGGFLLGFLAIGINPSAPYNLVAGGMLIAGMTVIVVRRQWFELELVGIVASYANHFIWLYGVYEGQGQRAMFPHHAASVGLVIGYWAVFRVSYLARRISGRDQESVSTFAGLLNPILFLIVMKYQGFHPEWAWWVLLAMGALEFLLGQLPVSRRRRAPFQILSSLGVTLMVASPVVKGSGNALEMIWLAGAEAFLLAGIFTRERLFRGFGLIISFLTALYAIPVRIFPLAQEIAAGQPHHHGQIALLLAVIAAALWANAHVTRRFWPDLFEEELETLSLSSLSFIASLFAVGAVYGYVPDKTVAVALAVLVAWLTGTGKLFSLAEMTYEAHWIAAVAFIQVIIADSSLATTTKWLGIPQRILAFASVAALLYLSSRFVRLSETRGKAIFSGVYAWAATALLTLLIWYQAAPWTIAVLWIVLGLALSFAGEALKRADLKWQAFVLVLLSTIYGLTFNMNLTATWPHLTYRLVSVSLIALGIYLLARWAPLPQIRPVYTVAGTLLLAVLAFKEAPELWRAVAWVSLALVLALAARWWKDRALLWQTHILAVLAAGWTLYTNLAPQHRQTPVQLLTVGIVAVVLYALTWLTNVATVIEDERICWAYPWAGSLLVSWLAWAQLQPIAVSFVWGLFALVLLEFPELVKSLRVDVSRSAANWRAQAYVALAGSFVHIFIANFNAPGWGPAAYAVLPLPLLYFYAYWKLGRDAASQFEKVVRVDVLMACLGTATLAALARFELPPDAVVIGYAGLVVGTLLVAWLTHRQVFVFQALVLLGITAFRISMNNFYHLHEEFGYSLSCAIWAIALLACAVPVAFQVRNTAQSGSAPQLFSPFLMHPEQPIFFAPVALLAVLLFLKLTGGWVTIAWGAEGFAVFVLALWAKERSFRWAGLSGLMLSVIKLAAYDIFFFPNWQVRALTWIGIGLLVLVVAFLYGKNREALRDYL
jgi:Predicted membrane protein (DUF2339)/zinc-ribbon domain